jgi:hypothetical protein
MKKTNNEPFYIGRGKNDRAYETYSRNKMWQNIVRKHDFHVFFLEQDLTEEESCDLEKYWINKIGRRLEGNGTLVNMTSGEDYSDTRNRNIAKALKGRTHKHSEETKRKIGDAHIGMKRSAYTKERISIAAKGRKRAPYSQETIEKLKNSQDLHDSLTDVLYTAYQAIIKEEENKKELENV